MIKEARLDKWLWSVRIFKTRTIAADACKKGRISIKDVVMKPSHMVKEGDIVQVKRSPVTYSFKVLQPLENRVGAKFVKDYLENVTTPDQYELLEMNRISGFVNRARGTGRPTKKERRELEQFTTADDFDFDFDSDEDNNDTTID
jgi:ribosome-associated heat shock protein Hsp15